MTIDSYILVRAANINGRWCAQRCTPVRGDTRFSYARGIVVGVQSRNWVCAAHIPAGAKTLPAEFLFLLDGQYIRYGPRISHHRFCHLPFLDRFSRFPTTEGTFLVKYISGPSLSKAFLVPGRLIIVTRLVDSILGRTCYEFDIELCVLVSVGIPVSRMTSGSQWWVQYRTTLPAALQTSC